MEVVFKASRGRFGIGFEPLGVVLGSFLELRGSFGDVMTRQSKTNHLLSHNAPGLKPGEFSKIYFFPIPVLLILVNPGSN